MNKVLLRGRMTADPEVKQVSNGSSVCSFRLAVNRSFKNKDGEYEADFINCVAWRATAEYLGKYAAKGRDMIVEGQLRSRSYDDKEGNHRTAYEVHADNIEFCDSKKTSGGEGRTTDVHTGGYEQNEPAPMMDVDDGELPF